MGGKLSSEMGNERLSQWVKWEVTNREAQNDVDWGMTTSKDKIVIRVPEALITDDVISPRNARSRSRPHVILNQPPQLVR